MGYSESSSPRSSFPSGNCELQLFIFPVSSPCTSHKIFTMQKIPISSMDIGVVVDETTMMPMRTVGSSTNGAVFLLLNLRRKDLYIYFELHIPSTARPSSPEEYRLRIPFSQLDRFFQTQNTSTGAVSHFTFLSSPPMYQRRIRNIETTFIEEMSWRESDTWFRQAQIVHNPQGLATLPASLRKQNPIIDIGESDIWITPPVWLTETM